MLLTLIHHFVKFELRKFKFDSGFILKIIALITVLYICLLLTYIGLHFTSLLEDYRPEANPVSYFNTILIYVFSFDFIIRFFTQPQTYIHTSAYYHLPLPRKAINLNNLILTLFNFNNLAILLLVIPFIATTLIPEIGWINSVLYTITISLILLFLNLVTFLVKGLIRRSIYYSSILVFWIICILIQKTFSETLSIPGILSDDLTADKLVPLVFLILAIDVTLVLSNLKLMMTHFYRVDEQSFILSEKLGNFLILPDKKLLAYLNLEIRLFLRNKRLRGIILITLFIGIMTFYLFSKTTVDAFTQFFWFTCLNGALGYSYAQYMFSWESRYFDFIASGLFDLSKTLKSKYILCNLGGILITLLVLPFIANKHIDLLIIMIAVLYNAGIGYWLIFYTATFNNRRMDLNSSIFFNIQGYDNLQLFSISLMILLPLICLFALRFILSLHISLLLIGALSLVSGLFHKVWIRSIEKQFIRRKYINLEGYRK